MTDARRAELVRMCESGPYNRLTLDRHEVLALLRDLAAAEARLAERDELRHAALAKADEAMNAKLAERKRCEQAEARVGMLHHLVAEARTYIDPEKYAAWDAAASAEVEPCDTLADQLIQAERERDVLRAERDTAQETGRRLANERDAALAQVAEGRRYDENVIALVVERDAALGDMASIADAVNGWCREVGGTSESTDATMPNVREALNRVGYRANAFRIERDAARTDLRIVAVQAQNTERENASLRARVAAAEQLADVLRRHTRRDCEGTWQDAVRDALAAWDATATDATGREGGKATVVVRDEEKA